MLLSELAEQLKGQLIGDGQLLIKGISEPEQGLADNIAIANSENILEQALKTEIAAIIVDKKPEQPLSKSIIVVNNCQNTFIELLELFSPKNIIKPKIHASACIDSTSVISNKSEIGPNVVIGQNCKIASNVKLAANIVIGKNVEIGKNCYIHPNVTIYDNSKIADDVTIHAGSVIGADGFGYQFNGKEHLKRHHLGNVVIGSNVEIGANTTIDRATIGTTHIGSGTKIDNLVQIAHNVTLGENNIVCAFSGIAGSTTIGNNVILAANVGVADHVTIEDNVTLGPRTGIVSNKKLSRDTTWLGNPGRPIKKALEQIVSMQRLPGIKKQIDNLKQRISDLEDKC